MGKSEASKTGIYVGMDIGGTKCAVSTGDVGDNGVQILTRREIKTPKRQEEAIERLIDMAGTATDGREVLGVGISAGGPMDAEKGVLKNPPNLPGWSGISLTEWVSRALRAPAMMENDANACALAEWKWGAGRGARNMIFLTFGTGMGAGLILDGKLYRGASGNAGEVGHWRLQDEGPEGYGKAGSFEGFCSGGGLHRHARTVAEECLKRGESSLWMENCDLKEIADAARTGDSIARGIFTMSARRLGQALALMIDFMNPEVIVLGSIYARCLDLMEEGVLEVIGREVLADSLACTSIRPAALGERIGDAAALALACEAARTSPYSLGP